MHDSKYRLYIYMYFVRFNSPNLKFPNAGATLLRLNVARHDLGCHW